MRVVSVNVGGPREIEWQGQTLRTSIFKTPVAGRIPVRGQNLDGDEQSDLSVHGGHDKAVYGYPLEHYEFWRAELPDAELPHGVFGENLTTEGLDEHGLSIGDLLRVGSSELMVTQPRLPCVKLGARLGRPDMPKRFLASRRVGFYFCIVREGDVAAGDAIEVVERASERMSVHELAELYATKLRAWRSWSVRCGYAAWPRYGGSRSRSCWRRTSAVTTTADSFGRPRRHKRPSPRLRRCEPRLII